MLRHPTGGAPKARSYRPQEMVIRLFGNISTGRPEDVHVLCMGHLHLALFMIYKGIAVYMVPCIVEMNEYLQGKTLVPDLGMWIAETGIDKEGNVVYVKNKYIAFDSKEDGVIKIK